ncbi:hypothetical protein MRB53_037079 [Persea americana]|nr:hypothetical protein MRB53_037079 [Persea americana]
MKCHSPWGYQKFAPRHLGHDSAPHNIESRRSSKKCKDSSIFTTAVMPSEVQDIKQFIEICRRKDASSARIKKFPASKHGKTPAQIKFKVRCKRYLYTLTLKDADKADKLKQSLPPGASRSAREGFETHGADMGAGLTIVDVPKKNAKGKRVAQKSASNRKNGIEHIALSLLITATATTLAICYKASPAAFIMR